MLRPITVFACLLALAGCGTSSSTSDGTSASTSHSSSTPATAATSSATTRRTEGAATAASKDPKTLVTLPGGPAAVVAGAQISRSTFDHWMTVAAKNEAAQAPGQPAIAPTDPPGFASCIAQLRKAQPSLAHASDKVVRATCSELYRTLSTQVMEFLIQSQWYISEAARAGITITEAQVTKTLDAEKAKQFPTAASFNAFLRQTGQTLSDITYRVRVNEAFSALSRRAHGNQIKVAATAKADLRPKTFCAPDVLVSDCSEYR